MDNVLRGFLSGAPMWTAIQVIVPWAFANFYAPRVSFAEHPVWLGFLCLIVPVIHEFHFFCIHRLIHMPMLNKWVHSVHRNSINPSPWSSLSLHPVEHLSCFLTMFHHLILRSNPVIALYQLHVAGFGAVPGHVGFDRIEVTDETLVDSHAYIHYLHHKHFEVNCGDGLIPIAKWLGTFHDGSKAADEQMKARYRGEKARANARKSARTPAERSADRAGAPGPHIRSQRTAASRGKPGGKTRKTLQKKAAMPWIDACSAKDIDAEDVRRFDHGCRTFIIVRNHEDAYFRTGGMCTHEDVCLGDGLVVGNTFECPKHSSILVPMTGAPVLRDLDDVRRWPTIGDLIHMLAHMSPALHSTAHHIVDPMDLKVSHRHLHITCSSMKQSGKTFLG